MTARKSPPPWKRASPKTKSTPLTPDEKATAKANAKKAGRPYPNLVDNMNVAKKRTTKGK